MATTNGLTKGVWSEYVSQTGEEVFAITHAIYNPSYVEWLESELRAARQKIKVPENVGVHILPFCASADVLTTAQSFRLLSLMPSYPQHKYSFTI